MNLGFKIVNNPDRKNEIVEVLDFFKVHSGYMIEVGFYFEPKDMDQLFLHYFNDESYRVNFHSTAGHSVFALQESEEAVRQDLDIAKKYNSAYSIIHLTPNQEFDRNLGQTDKLELSLKYLTRLNQIAEQANYTYYLENTYHSISFYLKLFKEIRKRQLDNIHFCFDIGHAKVWSHNTFREWYRFIGDLYAREFDLHFHLHMNHGVSDEHLSIVEYDTDVKDDFSEMFSYRQILTMLCMNFPAVRKIFEVKSDYALQNMHKFEKQILKSPVL